VYRLLFLFCKRATLSSGEREIAIRIASASERVPVLSGSLSIYYIVSPLEVVFCLFCKRASSSSGERVRVLSGSLASVRLPSERHPWIKSAFAILSIYYVVSPLGAVCFSSASELSSS
jgi:hypothetical protein